MHADRICALIGGHWRDAEDLHEVRDPYRGSVVAYAPVSSPQD